MCMDYCKFEITERELDRCLSDVSDHIEGFADVAISESQIIAFQEMMIRIHSFCQRYSLIDAEGGLDLDVLDDVCKAMAEPVAE